MTKFYVLHIWRGVGPSIFGPYQSEKVRDIVAKRRMEQSSYQDEIYWMDVFPDCSKPRIGAYPPVQEEVTVQSTLGDK